jgi:RNA polymerase sigma factor (TIGR02999 family)
MKPDSYSQLFTENYRHLLAIAARCIRREGARGGLEPAALVTELWLRLARCRELTIADSAHFQALATRIMRRILVDHARARAARKREMPIPWPRALCRSEPEGALAVKNALATLAAELPEEARIVKLRWIHGYSEQESAAILSHSYRTVRRRLSKAHTRLKELLV